MLRIEEVERDRVVTTKYKLRPSDNSVLAERRTSEGEEEEVVAFVTDAFRVRELLSEIFLGDRALALLLFLRSDYAAVHVTVREKVVKVETYFAR